MLTKFLKNYFEIGGAIAIFGALLLFTTMALHIIFRKQWILDYAGTVGVLTILAGAWTIAIGFIVTFLLKVKAK